MKYKVGDLVKIKKWEQLVKEYDCSYNNETGQTLYINTPYYRFLDEMRNYCGDIMEIGRIVDKAYLMKGSKYIWTDEMIERIANRLSGNATYNDLEPGMIITYQCGKKYFVTIINGEKYMMAQDQSIIVFPEKSLVLSHSVKSVEQIDDAFSGKSVFYAKTHVIWENTKEMTIKEAEEMLEEVLKVPVRITS